MQFDAQLLNGLQRCLAVAGAGKAAQISALRRLSDGWETDVYAFSAGGGVLPAPRDLILRIYPGEDVSWRLANEAHALERLRALGYPVPEVLLKDAGTACFGAPFLIMEQIHGRPMWKAYSSGQEMLNAFCALLAQLHSLEAGALVGEGGPWRSAADATGTFSLAFLWDKLAGPGLSDAFGPLLDRLAQAELSVKRTPSAVIHGDFHTENILVTESGDHFVIDWSNAAIDDPRVDVAQAVVLASTNGNPEWGQAVRAGYEACVGAPLRDFDYFELLALTRRVASMVIAAARGAASLGMRPGLEVQLRRHLPRLHQLVGHLEQRSGTELPGLFRLLDEAKEQAANPRQATSCGSDRP